MKELSLLTYNVGMTEVSPRRKNGKRAKAILPRVKDEHPEVIVFTELFANRPKSILLDGPRHGLLRRRRDGLKDAGYQFTDRPNAFSRPRNGGITIGSRYPILASTTHVFDNAVTRFHAKGVAYARIRKNDCYYHVFATHLQHGCDTHERAARRAQMREMGHFVRRQGIPDDEPILLAGDFNVGPGQGEKCSRLTVQHLLEALADTGVHARQIEPPFTDPTTKNGETLDHVFYVNRGLANSDYRTLKWHIKRGLPEDVFGGHEDGRPVRYLSDHHPLLTTFEFSPALRVLPVPLRPVNRWLQNRRDAIRAEGGRLAGRLRG